MAENLERLELLANLNSLDREYQALLERWRRLSASDDPIAQDRAADLEGPIRQMREALDAMFDALGRDDRWPGDPPEA